MDKTSTKIIKKTFISHAAADAQIVKPFVTLLESGIGISPKEIFCTSIKGQGIKPGSDFKNSIHDNLGNATTVVALISENFYNSPFCMCELGGVWLQAKDFIPVLVPPVNFSDMKAVLSGLQALRLNSAEDLDELRDDIADRLGIKALPTPRWNEKRDEFLRELGCKIAALPPSPSVPRSQLEKAEQMLEEYKQALAEAQEYTKKLQEINAKLLEAKDAKAVAQILHDNLDDVSTFEKLTDNLSASLNKLSEITCEAAFLYCLGEDLYLNGGSDFSWQEAKRPMEYKELILSSDERGVQLNEDSPKIKTVISHLKELGEWLGNQASNEFYEWYSSKNEGRTPDLTDRAFWDTHLW